MLPRLTLQAGIRAFVVLDALVVLALAWVIVTSDLFS